MYLANYEIKIRTISSLSNVQPSEFSPLFSFKSDQSGACGNADDVYNWKKHFYIGDISALTEQCGWSHSMDRVACEKCLQSKLGFQPNCGGKYFELQN